MKLVNTISNRVNRFQVIRNCQRILARHIFVSPGGALDDFLHETLHVVQIRLHPSQGEIRDFLSPTDLGEFGVRMSRTSETAAWLVAEITFPEGVH